MAHMLNKENEYQIIPIVIITYYLVYYIAGLIMSEQIYPVAGLYRGGERLRAIDYYDIYAASNTVYESPYNNRRYNKPPFVLLVNKSLSWLSFNVASVIWQSMICAVYFITLGFICRAYGESVCGGFLICLAGLFSYPFQFLIERGQLEAFSYSISLVSFIYFGKNRPAISGLAMAIALNIKPSCIFYIPIICVAANSFHKLFVYIIALLITSALIALLSPQLLVEFIYSAIERVNEPMIEYENGSLARAMIGLPHSGNIAIIVWSVLYLIFLIRIKEGTTKGISAKVMLNIFIIGLPYCQALPSLAYIYGYAYFIAAVFAIKEISRFGKRAHVPILILGGAGICMAYFPSVAASEVTRISLLWHWIPSMGMLALMVFSCLCCKDFLRAHCAIVLNL